MLTENVVDAADTGLPQHRVRLFMVGARKPISIPEIWAPTRDVLDFDSGSWSPIFKPGRSPATIRRWEAGRERFGDCFLMPCYSQGSGTTGCSLDRPLGTVRTVRTKGWMGRKMLPSRDTDG
jgi:DNA (cytosine-5)-methyltransferase 1